MKAKLIKVGVPGFTGCANLYQLESGEYVVVSGVVAMFSGAEVLMFKADAEGKVSDWLDIESVRGYTDPARAMRDWGYTVEE